MIEGASDFDLETWVRNVGIDTQLHLRMDKKIVYYELRVRNMSAKGFHHYILRQSKHYSRNCESTAVTTNTNYKTSVTKAKKKRITTYSCYSNCFKP